MCALAGGRSIESTMGFTALDGLPMGTRSGQIDPGVLLYMLAERGMSAKALEDLLYRESGLKGMSGLSNDMRELEASGAPAALLAIEYFVYRIGLNAGILAAALGGLDAFVFTAGIGENSPMIRSRVAEKLAWLGARCDPAANNAARLVISHPHSKVATLCRADRRRADDRAAHALACCRPNERGGLRCKRELKQQSPCALRPIDFAQ